MRLKDEVGRVKSAILRNHQSVHGCMGMRGAFCCLICKKVNSDLMAPDGRKKGLGGYTCTLTSIKHFTLINQLTLIFKLHLSILILDRWIHSDGSCHGRNAMFYPMVIEIFRMGREDAARRFIIAFTGRNFW